MGGFEFLKVKKEYFLIILKKKEKGKKIRKDEDKYGKKSEVMKNGGEKSFSDGSLKKK